MIRTALAVGISFACVGCVSNSPDAGPNGPGGGKADGAGHQLPGYDETLLAADPDGKLAVLHVGDTFEKQDVAPPVSEGPLTIYSRNDRFYVVYRSGSVAVVDPASGEVEQTVTFGAPIGDVVWASDSDDDALYVSLKSGSVIRTQLAAPSAQATIDLSSLKLHGRIEVRRMLRLGTQLFVQVARFASSHPERGAIAVIDTTTDTLAKVIELEGTDDTGSHSIGLNPNRELVHDPVRNLVFVSAVGDRPNDPGALFRIDPTTLEIHDVKAAQSGFQGMVALGPPYETVFIMYHTSTPVTSSHLFAYSIDGAGQVTERSNKTLNDAFDGLDAMDVNRSGTLVTMANTCAIGFCIGGAGLYFGVVDSLEALPKLMAADIGFEPAVVQFQ